MANTKSPAGGTGGRRGASGVGQDDGTGVVDSLPDKLRVHALAKLLSVSSKEVMATMAELGVTVRSAQSSISRETALRAIEVLLPDPDSESVTVDSEEPDVVEVRGSGTSARSPATPVFNVSAPMFLPPSPVPDPDEIPESDLTGEEDTPESGPEGEGGTRRRRRRGRRGRGRGRGTDSASGDAVSGTTDSGNGDSDQGDDDQRGTDLASESAEDGDDEITDGAGRRRRRRRRRRDGGGDDAATREDDPPDTVVHVRDSKDRAGEKDRSAEDEVQAVRGSTRLEAKRQRRRDGREAGRRRAPILSEAEFLTRRESVARRMVVREDTERIEIAVLEDDILVEHFVTASGSGSLVGNVYLGKVQNVLPSMEAAFVDIGRGRNAVLYAGEVDWDAAGLEGKARRIEQALSSGDSVLVQVTKDPVGHKGARLTTQISLPGRFLVYVPGGRATGISRKLPDNERKRLKDVLKRIVPEDAGVIIRTASEGVSEEELGRDVRRLQAQWEVIQSRSGTSDDASSGRKVSAPELLYEEPDLLVKVVRDLFTEDFRDLVVQGDEAWGTVEGYVQHVAPELIPRVRRYTGNADVFADYRIDEQIVKALDRKVWLPSGGYLVIDRTEAMTVIDVNTGKFTGAGGNLEETVTRNNLEAAEEIIRQLRLRDIGGIIVIDFIDMVLESNRDLVLRRLTECLGRDRTRHQVAEITSLGLVQMTRKKVGTGLLEAHSSVCDHCKGRGVLISTEPVNVRATGSEAADAATNGGGGRSRGRGFSGGSSPAEVAPPEVAAVPDSAAGREPAAEGASEQRAPAAEPGPIEAPAAETAAVEARAAEAPAVEARATESPAAAETRPAEPVSARRDEPAPVTEPTPQTSDRHSLTEHDPDPLVRSSVNGTAGVSPEVPAQPVRTTTRRRRAASRPAGPPDTDQPEGAGSQSGMSSAVSQAG